MRISIKPVRPCTLIPTPKNVSFIQPRTLTQLAGKPCTKHLTTNYQPFKKWEHVLDLVDHSAPTRFTPVDPVKLGAKWTEYQGIRNWDGLLDPLDDKLRNEILRYGHFVEAAYKSFDFDSSSPCYGTCLYSKNSLFPWSGLPKTGYRITKNLKSTSGIQSPKWIEKAPNWVKTQSSWIGYVAVCQDKEEIARLGRRDIVIAYRGTATCLEWLENLRATLSHVPNKDSNVDPNHGSDCKPMVESGFLSLYSSGTSNSPSLQQTIREEISRLLQSYGGERLSLTITGHSLGAALATLTAYDIKENFKRAPMVTVISFGGPRVGNRSFRQKLEKQGTRVLRIVNSDDVITKVPGFVVDEDEDGEREQLNVIPGWIQKRVEDTQWVYSEVGRELRLNSRDSPHLCGINVATCH